MEIIWSPESEIDYYQNLIYLSENWPESVAQNFIKEVENVLKSIKDRPDLYPLINQGAVRKAVLRKQISLYYQIEEGDIHLIRFWNNYQNPDLLKV